MTAEVDGGPPYGPVRNGTLLVTFWEYRPAQAPAYAFVVLFAIASLVHLVCIFLHRAWFFIPFVLGGICEIFGYHGRAQAHDDPTALGPWILQNMLLLAGPPFLAASMYMSLGRVTTVLGAQKASLISPRWLTKIYVLLDIGCIASQFIGSVMPASGKPEAIRNGRLIVIAGLITQLIVLIFFIINSVHIYKHISTGQGVPSSAPPRWRQQFRVIEAVTLLMIIRSVMRAIEYLQGEGGYILSHEIFIYLFDGAMMFTIMVVFVVIHPGMFVRKALRAKTSPEIYGEHIRLRGWSSG